MRLSHLELVALRPLRACARGDRLESDDVSRGIDDPRVPVLRIEFLEHLPHIEIAVVWRFEESWLAGAPDRHACRGTRLLPARPPRGAARELRQLSRADQRNVFLFPHASAIAPEHLDLFVDNFVQRFEARYGTAP